MNSPEQRAIRRQRNTSIGVHVWLPFMALAVVWHCFAPFACAGDIEKVLLEDRRSFSDSRPTEFPDAVGYIGNCYNFWQIEIDEKAFAAEKRPAPEKLHVSIPELKDICMDSVLREVLPQAQAVYEIRGNKIVVVPNTDNGRRQPFPPITEAQIKAMKKLRDRLLKTGVEAEVDVRDREIKSTIRQLLEDDNVAFVIDEKGIGKKALERIITIPKGSYTLDSMLKLLLDEVGAIYEVRPDYIRIIPATKS